jgi:hypothetical protein
MKRLVSHDLQVIPIKKYYSIKKSNENSPAWESYSCTMAQSRGRNYS